MNKDVTELSKLGKKKKFQLRRKHSNSKYGCLQCKKRRIKCGQELPQCKHCVSYRAKKLRCSYMDLSEAEKQLILDASSRPGDDDSIPPEQSPSGRGSSPSVVTNDASVLKPDPRSGSATPYRMTSASPGRMYQETPVQQRLPRATAVQARFELYKIHMVTDDTQLLNEVFLFISKNLKMPIISSSYVRYIEFIWNLWGNTTIVDATKNTLANYYSLITWASSYLSTCIYNSVKGNSKSHLGKKSKKIVKPLRSIALTNNAYLLQNLTLALDKSDYRLLLNLMSLNTFLSSSNYQDDGYKSRMLHLNGLVAIIYELYVHGNKSTIYVPGSDDYRSEDLSFFDSISGQARNSHVAEASGDPQHTIQMTRNGDNSNFFVPGYSYFNNFSAKESILIKFFEWQVYLAATAIFFPPYNHHCLHEFYQNFLDFKNLLNQVNNKLLIHYADNLIKYIRYLIDEIFPLLEKNENHGKLFELHPKVYYTIYMKYLLATPPELFLALHKGSHLSAVERILYRYYNNLAKILDQIFPQIRYLFILGFVSAYMHYSDEVNVLNDVLFNSSDSYLMVPPDYDNEYTCSQEFCSAIKYHAMRCMRVFNYFRTRNILLHHGVFYTDPFPDFIKNNRFVTRKVFFEETQIQSFDNTFINPEHYPHSPNGAASFHSGAGTQNTHTPPTFKGYSLDELKSMGSDGIDMRVAEKSRITPRNLMRSSNCPKDSNGNIVGYDYVVNPLKIPVVLRHLVGKSLRDLYDDRSILFNYYEENEV